LFGLKYPQIRIYANIPHEFWASKSAKINFNEKLEAKFLAKLKRLKSTQKFKFLKINVFIDLTSKFGV